MVMPGDTVTFKVKLLAPIAMEQGLRFCYPRRWPQWLVLVLLLKINK